MSGRSAAGQKATTGDRYLAAALFDYDVSHVFTVPTVAVPSFRAMDELGIRGVSAHSEKAAAYMADGYARLTGRPGVCMSQGIGAANLLSGLRDALMACSPVLAITGGAPDIARYRHLYQDADDFGLFDRYTKMNCLLGDVRRLPDLLRQAFRSATTGAPGPVHLELEGVLGEILAGTLDAATATGPRAEPRFGRVPPFRPAADPGDVRSAVDLLRKSKRPVLIAGGGARTSGAGAVLLEVAQALGAPIATSLHAKGLVDERLPEVLGVVGSSSRESANRMVARADAVLFVGSHCGSQVTDGWRLPSAGKAKIVQLDIDPEELGRNYPNDVSLLGDARTVLEQVKRELATRANGADEQPRANAAWLEDCRSTSARWRRRAAKRWHDGSVPMRPERLCQALSSALPDDAVLVVDTGHAGIWAASMIDMRPPQSFLRSAGSLGWALPAAIGAKCGAMERPVVGFTGDGGFYYHLAELETAKRLGLPVVIVVNDNRSFSQDFEVFNNAYDGSQTSQGRSMWWFEDVDLAQVAASFGWEAERIERPGGLDAALSKAIAAGRPVLLDVVTDPMALAEPPFGGRSYYATGGSGDS